MYSYNNFDTIEQKIVSTCINLRTFRTSDIRKRYKFLEKYPTHQVTGIIKYLLDKYGIEYQIYSTVIGTIITIVKVK